uniref:Uncharacterized protein n=1 Tax=Bursaphelenchus xylophilus TaxID=6326 RepID=A0A1I7RL30_BURXY
MSKNNPSLGPALPPQEAEERRSHYRIRNLPVYPNEPGGGPEAMNKKENINTSQVRSLRFGRRLRAEEKAGKVLECKSGLTKACFQLFRPLFSSMFT